MIVCPHCSKENQDRYRFCLGCGAELPRDGAHAPKSFTAPTPPAGVQSAPQGGFGGPPPAGAFGGAPPQGGSFGAPQGGFGAPPQAAPSAGFGAPMPMAAPAPAPAPAPAAMAVTAPPVAGGDLVKCTNCGNSNNRSFKFCGTCGAPLNAAPAAAAPAPAPMAAPAPAAGAQRGTLVLIRADGSEGDSFPIQERTVIGREAGGLFASDSYLSPRHATFQFTGANLTVQDEGSLNGVYMRIAADTPTEVKDKAIFRIGQEIIRFERLTSAPMKDGVELMGSPAPNYIGRICLIIGRETNGNCYAIPQGGLHLGRERGDILFPDDGYVSGLHCRLHEENGRLMITDVGSSNGTFTRLAAGATPVPPGSMLLLGQQLFRVEY